MHKINYRPGKLMLSAAASLLIALWLGLGWSSDDSILWILGAALFAYLAFASIRTAIGDGPAIAYDARQVIVNTLHRGIRHDWSEVGDVALERQTTRYFGIIPGSKKDFLCVRIGAGSSRTYRINAALVDLPRGGIEALHRDLAAIRIAAVGVSQTASADIGPAAASFDADAAIARYLAAKQAEPVAPPAPAAPAFRHPPRPTFGRRTG